MAVGDFAEKIGFGAGGRFSTFFDRFFDIFSFFFMFVFWGDCANPGKKKFSGIAAV